MKIDRMDVQKTPGSGRIMRDEGLVYEEFSDGTVSFDIFDAAEWPGGQDQKMAYAELIAARQKAAELAYGLLWLTRIDTTTRTGWLTQRARLALIDTLGRNGQAAGIERAKKLLGLERVNMDGFLSDLF